MRIPSCRLGIANARIDALHALPVRIAQGAEMAEIMSQEIHELMCQLRDAP